MENSRVVLDVAHDPRFELNQVAALEMQRFESASCRNPDMRSNQLPIVGDLLQHSDPAGMFGIAEALEDGLNHDALIPVGRESLLGIRLGVPRDEYRQGEQWGRHH